MRTAAQTRQELEKLRRRTLIVCAVHAIVYGLAIALAAVGQRFPGGILAGANLLAYVLFLRKYIGGYSEAAARENILLGLCAPLDEAAYTGSKGMAAEQFRALAMLPLMEGENHLLVRNGFSGRGFGLDLSGCELTLHYAAQGAKGAVYRFLSGTLLTAAPQSGVCEGDWLLLRRELLDESVQSVFLEEHGYTPANCPDSGLDDRFQLYAGGGAEDMPRRLAGWLARAADKMDRMAAVRLTNREAAVYLENRFYTGRTRVRDLPNEEWLAHCPLPERDEVWELFRSWSTAEQQ